jgi:hypothetical protein
MASRRPKAIFIASALAYPEYVPPILSNTLSLSLMTSRALTAICPSTAGVEELLGPVEELGAGVLDVLGAGVLEVSCAGVLEVSGAGALVLAGGSSELGVFDGSAVGPQATKPIAKMVEIIAKSFVFFIMKCSLHYNCDFFMKSYLTSYYNKI